MPVGRQFEWHHHHEHQLAWSPEGVLVVRTHDGSYVLPPTRALWIPAGTSHETRASGAAVLRSVYVRTRDCPIAWDSPTPVEVSALLRELIPHLEDDSLTDERRLRGEALLFDLLAPLAVATIDVRVPTDERANRVAEGLLADPGDRKRGEEVEEHGLGAEPPLGREGVVLEVGDQLLQQRAHFDRRRAVPCDRAVSRPDVDRPQDSGSGRTRLVRCPGGDP